MIVFKSNGGKVAAALRQIADEHPREFPRILATVGLGLRKKVSAAMPNGAPPLKFAPYNQFTLLLRLLRKKSFKSLYTRSMLGTRAGIKSGLKTKRNGDFTKASLKKLERRANYVNKIRRAQHKANKGFGGILNRASSMRYKATKTSFGFGWFDKLKPYANSLSTKESRNLSKEERHFRHKIQGENIERQFIRPARPVMQPFADSPATHAYIIDAARKRLNSIIEKNLSKVSGAVA